MLTGILTLQRSFRAAHHHAKSQIEQARLLNYIARDLRRALTVKVDNFAGGERLNLTIPDFYDPSGVPRDPAIKNGAIEYGDPSQALVISYYKNGSKMVRSVNGITTILASDVGDFIPDFTDDGKQSVGVSISFVPKFQLNARDISTLRNGTATYATTLLRNKRRN